MKFSEKLIGALCVLAVVSACAGLFGGGGGSSSCGCGCGGGSSGCGRKKRSVEVEPPKFNNLAAEDKDQLCNSVELKSIIQENMRDTAEESGKSISAHLEQFGDRFVVICSEKEFFYAVRHDMEYCGARNTTHYCQAFAV